MRQSSLTPIAWPAAPRVSNVLCEGGELEDFRQSEEGVEIAARLADQVGAVGKKQNAPQLRVHQEPMAEDASGVGLAGAGRHLDRCADDRPRAIIALPAPFAFILLRERRWPVPGDGARASDTDMDDRLGLPQGAFAKIDAEEDELFYEPPRLVCHIDNSAIAALTGFYRIALPASGVLLDLMSSWVSHLSPEIDYAEVIGHGMNATELAANPRLTRWFVQNLNRDTGLPLTDASIDAAMICVSIQYLQQPMAVLREVARVLRPGSPLVISFSNRCFWTKAVAIWRALDDDGHARLVERYLRHSGFEGIETHRLAEWVEDVSDPMTAVVGRAPAM